MEPLKKCEVLIVGEDYKNEWRPNQPGPEYHADYTAVSSGRLRQILKSPNKFLHGFNPDGEEPEPTKAMRFGQLVHMAFLEPERFEKALLIEPEFTGFTKDGRLSTQSAEARERKRVWYEQLEIWQEVCTRENYEHLRGMVESIKRHKEAQRLLSSGQNEVSGYYRDPETGIQCRIRPDFIKFSLNALCDLKTTISIDAGKFGRKAWDFRYDFQMAMYAEGVQQITGKYPDYVNIIAVEKSPPYEVVPMLLDHAQLERGAQDYHTALRRLKHCMENNHWPPQYEGIQSLALPYWAFNEA